MEEIKVTKELKTSVVFTWGDPITGFHQTGGIQNVANKDPKTLEIDPRVVHFYFGDQTVLTDETGRTFIASDGYYDGISPLIHCGKAVSISEALTKFSPETWQYRMIQAYQKDDYDKIAISANGFVEGIDKGELTLEEYVESYENFKGKQI